MGILGCKVVMPKPEQFVTKDLSDKVIIKSCNFVTEMGGYQGQIYIGASGSMTPGRDMPGCLFELKKKQTNDLGK